MKCPVLVQTHTQQFQQLREAGIDPEQICYRLALDVFPSEDILLDTSRHHPEYLDDRIDFDLEFCYQIQQAYKKYCLFCSEAGHLTLPNAYWLNVRRTRCGEQTSLEEVLSVSCLF